jgi:serine/threonine protein kinase
MRGVVGGAYRLKTVIGSGGFGSVHCACLLDSEKEVAVKISLGESKNRRLEIETHVYQILTGAVGFPDLIASGVDHERNFIAVELLGKPLSTLLYDQPNSKFSLKTTLMLAEQMLERIEYVHAKGILHRDLKPSNFLMGLGSKSNELYLIDFGLSADYSRAGRAEAETVGTAVFSSVNAQRGMAVSRRDDLESLVYTLVYIATGSLPWVELAGDRRSREKIGGTLVAAAKSSISATDLCAGLPDEFAAFLERVKALELNEEPDYSGYRKMFRDLFNSRGFVYDYIYDWQRPVRANLSFEFLGPKLLTPPEQKVNRARAKTSWRDQVRKPLPVSPRYGRIASPTPDIAVMGKKKKLEVSSG